MSKKLIDTLSENIDFNEAVNQAAAKVIEAENANKPKEKHVNVKDYYEALKRDMDSPNEIIADRATKAAAAFTQQLTQLVLKQALDKIDLSEKENKIISKFRQLDMKEGNTYQFILNLNTGVENYSDTPFVPEEATDPQTEVKNINFFKADRTLGDWSFQWHKMQTLRPHEWTPYFKSNTLSEFVGSIVSQMGESITLMKRAKVQKFLKNLSIGKQITGAASNVDCYDAFIELMDHIDTMQFDTNEYCLNAGSNSPSKNIKAAKKSDLIMLINKKTLNLLRTGIKARLTNPSAFNLEQVVDADNIVEFYKMVNDTVNTKTVITTSNDDVIAPNEIKVIDKQGLVMINKLYFSGEQLYNTNMNLQLDVHYWFMIDSIPWRKGLKFTDTKLTVVPQ